MGIASYSRDPLYPEDDFSAHFNLGYWNHNDVGEQLTNSQKDKIRVTQMTQGNYIRCSSHFSLLTVLIFVLSYLGQGFLAKPPVTAYSREAVAYFSPGVSYKAYRWLAVNFGADIRLNGNNDITAYAQPGSPSQIFDTPNYPSWRINLGTKLTILPTSLYAVSERDLLMEKANSRRELFEQIIKEQRETESAEAELERIKEERRTAEKELERLRQILEGEARRQQEEETYNSDDSY